MTIDNTLAKPPEYFFLQSEALNTINICQLFVDF